MSRSVEWRRTEILRLLSHDSMSSVADLCNRFGVSGMTIRRDLAVLEADGDIVRVRGGARLAAKAVDHGGSAAREVGELGASDVLVLNPMDPRMARMIIQESVARNVPIIAESLPFEGSTTSVAIDSYQAGIALGRWIGEYAANEFGGEVRMLFLGFRSGSDTAARERGFLDGLHEVVPDPAFTLSVNAQGLRDESFGLARAALSSYPEINIIVGHNDQSALGAVDALRSLGVPLADVLIGTFGLEGAEGRRVLLDECPRAVGVAMFPELIGQVCVDVAVKAFNGWELPERVTTPTVIVTRASMSEHFQFVNGAWVERLDVVQRLRDTGWSELAGVLPPGSDVAYPSQISFVRYLHDEYYEHLVAGMKRRSDEFGIRVTVRDAARDLELSIESARQSIARAASALIKSGDSVILDAGTTTCLLAAELVKRRDEEFTIITNSLCVFDVVEDARHINLIGIGGLLHRPSRAFLDVRAEDRIDGLRVDEAFLGVKGISVEYGISSEHLREAEFKRSVISAAKHVIVLADSFKIGHISLSRIAPVSAVEQLVTDDQITSQDRLAFTQAGVEVVVAERIGGRESRPA